MHPGLQSNADNIQGVLGEGTLGYKSNVANVQGVLGEGPLGHKVILMIYRVCLVLLYRVCLVKALWVTK